MRLVAVAGFVTPGAMVDVMTTGSTKEGGNITRTVLENVRVLAANQRIESQNGKPVGVAVITLLVSPRMRQSWRWPAAREKFNLRSETP